MERIPLLPVQGKPALQFHFRRRGGIKIITLQKGKLYIGGLRDAGAAVFPGNFQSHFKGGAGKGQGVSGKSENGAARPPDYSFSGLGGKSGEFQGAAGSGGNPGIRPSKKGDGRLFAAGG